jgi:hypothetical protein
VEAKEETLRIVVEIVGDYLDIKQISDAAIATCDARFDAVDGSSPGT